MKKPDIFASDFQGDPLATFADDDDVGQGLVKSRKKISRLFSSFSALMKAAGIDEACRQLNRLEIERVQLDPNYTPLKFEPNEIRRMYQTLVEVAQSSEYEAEKGKRLYTRERWFKVPAFALELAYRQEEFSPELTPRLKVLPPDLAKRKRKLIAALGRNWMRRYRKLHLVQSYLHLALVDKDANSESIDRDGVRTYFERISDLLTAIAQRAGDRDRPVKRYNATAATVLDEFRKKKEHVYSPLWTPEAWVKERADKNGNPKEKKARTKAAKTENKVSFDHFAEEVATFEDVEAATCEVIKGLKVLSAREGWSEDEEIERFDRLHQLIELQRTSPDDDGGAQTKVLSPVITNADTTSLNAGKSDGFAHSAVTNIADFLSKNKKSDEIGVTQMSGGSLTPEEEARTMIEACESVGATMFKAAFTSIYPLKGLAAELPPDERSYPRKKHETATATELKAQIPEFIRRNREQQHNVAVRVWGPWFQADDCSPEFYEQLKPYCFAAVRTSPKSYNVLLAFSSSFVGSDGKRNDALVAVRDRFFAKCRELGETANGGAYGSVRMPGTLNVKEKYLGDFPYIELAYTSMGRRTTPEELDAAGFLAPAPVQRLSPVNSGPRRIDIRAPRLDYQYFVNRCSRKPDSGEPNLNGADEAYVIYLMGSCGHSRSDAGAELRGVRDKAARRPDYVERTLDAAERWIATHSTSDRERVAI